MARELTDSGHPVEKFPEEINLDEQEESPSDPWKHRSSGMKCSTCMWYVRKPPSFEGPSRRVPVGRCRRHAPAMNGYPVVYPHDWCGDHKLDETKL